MGVYTYDFPRPSVTVDVVIFGKHSSGDPRDTKILLIRRGWDPHKGKWAIPGGYLNIDEELEDAAARELWEETGVAVDSSSLVQFGVYGAVDRDPRGRVITVGYFGYVYLDKCKPVGMDDAVEAKWFGLTQLPRDLAFDHQMVIENAISVHQWKTDNSYKFSFEQK